MGQDESRQVTINHDNGGRITGYSDTRTTSKEETQP